MRAVERTGRASGDFCRGPAAPPPAHRVAQLLRQCLGDDFDALIGDIKACVFRSFQREVSAFRSMRNASASIVSSKRGKPR